MRSKAACASSEQGGYRLSDDGARLMALLRPIGAWSEDRAAALKGKG